jgi:hypothetical protein
MALSPLAELALGVLRAEHDQLAHAVRVGAPLVLVLLVRARLPPHSAHVRGPSVPAIRPTLGGIGRRRAVKPAAT